MRTSPDWTSGYITDIEYTHGFYRELAPGYLCFAALMAGYPSPTPYREANFTYCELGCGNGVSTNIFASAYPQAQFYGIDYNPSHIVYADGLSRQAGLTNINFWEADFRYLDKEPIPPCDFIVCHGVYSWISQENQRAIQDFVQKKLKPGGIFYISYNCLPGWSATGPVQHLFRLLGENAQGSIMDKVSFAIDKFEQAFQIGQGYFSAQDAIQTRLDQIKSLDKAYVAHEYFNEEWQPFYHSQIVRRFQDAKVSYIGSAELFDVYTGVYLGEKQQQLINQYGDQEVKETLKDFFVNRQFRKDLFVRGPLKLSNKEQKEYLLDTQFVLAVPRETLSLDMKFSFCNARGKEEIYLPVADALAQGPKMLEALSRIRVFEGKPLANLLQTVSMLCASGQVDLAFPADKRNIKSVGKMNQAILAQAMYSPKLTYMVSPISKTGVEVSWLEQLFIKALEEKQVPEHFAWETMLALDQRMQKNGNMISDPKANLAEIQAQFLLFEQKYKSLFRVLGIDI